MQGGLRQDARGAKARCKLNITILRFTDWVPIGLSLLSLTRNGDTLATRLRAGPDRAHRAGRCAPPRRREPAFSCRCLLTGFTNRDQPGADLQIGCRFGREGHVGALSPGAGSRAGLQTRRLASARGRRPGFGAGVRTWRCPRCAGPERGGSASGPGRAPR